MADSVITSEETEVEQWLHVKPRQISLDDWTRFEGNIAEIFTALGMDLHTPGTLNTPTRFLKAMFDATDGYEGDEKLIKVFPTECKDGPDCHSSQVVEGPIAFSALCEHHALPFFGTAYVGYIPHDCIIGLSKMTRLVRLFARRFSVQERLGQEIADALVAISHPHGVAVSLEAAHLCTRMRGVEEAQSQTVTTNWRGNYDSDEHLRQEFLAIANK
jgi:GTP cyclohydrolase I